MKVKAEFPLDLTDGRDKVRLKNGQKHNYIKVQVKNYMMKG